MKKYLLLLFIITIAYGSFAQGNGKQKANGKTQAVKVKKNDSQTDNLPANGSKTVSVKTKKNNATVISKNSNSVNQPSKVRAGFSNDYPSATNVVWSKYRGDWTATFNNAGIRSTAVYHANGVRKDTRTNISANQLPGSIWERIFKRDNVTPVSVVQIQSPQLSSEVYRVASKKAGSATRYYYYNSKGDKVQYNY